MFLRAFFAIIINQQQWQQRRWQKVTRVWEIYDTRMNLYQVYNFLTAIFFFISHMKFYVKWKCLFNMDESKYVYCVITLMNNIKFVRVKGTWEYKVYEVKKVISRERKIAWEGIECQGGGNMWSEWENGNDKWKTCRFSHHKINWYTWIEFAFVT